MKKNFAIIGYGKMGKIYHKYLQKNNLKLLYIKNSSKRKTLNLIKKNQNLKNVKYLENGKNYKNLNTIIITTPIKNHLAAIKNCMNLNKNIIVEKPIFYQHNLSYKKSLSLCEEIFNYKNQIYVNLSNIYLANYYKKFFKNKGSSFDFKFFTQGNYKYQYIIADLIPHFFSIFPKIENFNDFKCIKKIVKKHSSSITLEINDIKVNILLKQNCKKKHLSFGFKNKIVKIEQSKTKKFYNKMIYKSDEIIIKSTLEKFLKNCFVNIHKKVDKNYKTRLFSKKVHYNTLKVLYS